MKESNKNIKEIKINRFKIKKFAIVKIVVFSSILVIGMIVSVLLPLRGTYSEKEKRKLTTFPQFSFQTFSDGTYFDQIGLWFSDTFPGRDMLLGMSEEIKSLYGKHSSSVIGEIKVADEIPDINNDDILASIITERREEDTENENKFGYDDLKQDIQAEDVTTQFLTDNGSKTTENYDAEDVAEKDDGERMGSIYVLGDSAYNYYYFSKKNSDEYADITNRLAEELKGKADVYSMIVPTSIDISLNENIRNRISSSNQKKAILYMYSRMNEAVKRCYVYDNIYDHRDEYEYFRTDHHWTVNGAYRAYEVFAWQTGREIDLSNDFSEMNFDGFTGSFYTQTGMTALKDNPDTVKAYVPLAVNDMFMINMSGQEIDYKIITDVSEWNSVSLYSTFIGGDNPYVQITNPEIADGSSVLLIKESYGNAFAPFLADSYQNVYVIDYRYYKGTVSSLVDEKGIDTVVMLNNITATSTSERINDLEKVCR